MKWRGLERESNEARAGHSATGKGPGEVCGDAVTVRLA